MKKLLAFLLLLTLPALAQLVVVDQDYRVQRVDVGRRQIVVVPPDEDDPDMHSTYAVLLGRETPLVDTSGHPRRLQDVHPGMTVHVQGGLSWNLKIDARRVVIVDR